MLGGDVGGLVRGGGEQARFIAIASAHALAALDRAGLVSARREGRETRYTLTPAPLGEAMRWMDDVGAEWDARLARLADRR